MADNPFNRTVLYPLEKPLADDLNQQFSQGDRAVRDTFFHLFRGAQGFLGTSFLVQQSSPAALSVVLKAGIGWQNDAVDVVSGISSVVGLNDLSAYKPIVLETDLTIAVPTAPVSNSRIDLIEVRYNRALNNPQSRNFLDPNTNAFSPATVSKTLDFNVDGTLAYYAAAATPTTALAYKSGVVSASPVAPTTDTGYLPLAYIAVGTGVTTIVTADITVLRAMLGGGQFLGRQIFTANGTYTPTTGATRARINIVGGGGGSGGIDGTNLEFTVTPGGASGIHIEKTIDGNGVQLTGGPVVIGAAGTPGGTSPQTNGGTGGDTTIVINGITWTAKGGPGGLAGVVTGAADAGPSATATATGSSVGDYETGSHGGPAYANRGGTTVARGFGGNGGSNALGTGGAPRTSGAADPGRGYGSGGGGYRLSSVGNVAGAAGAPGIVIVDEWT